MLDLEKDEGPRKIDIEFPPFYWFVQDDKYMIINNRPQEVVISEIVDGRVVEKERWQPKIGFEYKDIYVSSHGILVYNRKEYEVHPFRE